MDSLMACCLRRLHAHVRPGRARSGSSRTLAPPVAGGAAIEGRELVITRPQKPPRAAVPRAPRTPGTAHAALGADGWPGSRGAGLSTDRYTASRRQPTPIAMPLAAGIRAFPLRRRRLDLGGTEYNVGWSSGRSRSGTM